MTKFRFLIAAILLGLVGYANAAGISGGPFVLTADNVCKALFGSGYPCVVSNALTNGHVYVGNGSNVAMDTAPGTGLTGGAGSISSNATEHMSYQPGLITTIVNTKSVFAKFSKASTVDNLEGSSQSFTCTVNPVITMYECGVSSTCASSPVTIGTVTVTAAGTVVDGTVSAPAITAGDYVAFAISAGTCTGLDISAVAQVHAN